jgi:hypothetical protein
MSLVLNIPPIVESTWETYSEIADRIVKAKSVTVECAGDYSLRKTRAGVRAHIEKRGLEMRSTKQGTALCMWVSR